MMHRLRKLSPPSSRSSVLARTIEKSKQAFASHIITITHVAFKCNDVANYPNQFSFNWIWSSVHLNADNYTAVSFNLSQHTWHQWNQRHFKTNGFYAHGSFCSIETASTGNNLIRRSLNTMIRGAECLPLHFQISHINKVIIQNLKPYENSLSRIVYAKLIE